MKTTTLQFHTLTELAAFTKTVNPRGYRINTQLLTLSAPLTEFELAIAIERYGVIPVQSPVTAPL